MSDEIDFQSEAIKFIMTLRVLSELPLKKMKEIISTADVLGPIVDPTAYKNMLYRKGGNMHDIARLIDLSIPLVEEFSKLKEKVEIATK